MLTHTYPINRYCFSSSRDVVFEIFHASHCHYILLKKNHPPEQHVYLRSRSVLLQRDVAFLRSISFEFTDDFLGSWMTAPILDGVHSRLQISNHTTSCDVVFFGDLLTNQHFSLQHHFIFISTHIMCKKSPCRQASRLDHVILDWFTYKSLYSMGKSYSIDRVK